MTFRTCQRISALNLRSAEPWPCSDTQRGLGFRKQSCTRRGEGCDQGLGSHSGTHTWVVCFKSLLCPCPAHSGTCHHSENECGSGVMCFSSMMVWAAPLGLCFRLPLPSSVQLRDLLRVLGECHRAHVVPWCPSFGSLCWTVWGKPLSPFSFR